MFKLLTKGYIKKIVAILLFPLLLFPTIYYFPHKGAGDMEIWLEWMSHIQMWGPLNAYGFINARPDFWTVQPPLYFINLWLAIKMAAVFGVSLLLGVKIMLLFYYTLTLGSLIYLSTVFSKRSIWLSILITSALFFGGLYFTIMSMVFTTLDISFAPMIVLSLIFFARSNYFRSGVFFAIALFIKWLNIVLLPVFLFYFVSKNHSRFEINTRVVHFIAGLVFVCGAVVSTFWFNNLSLASIYQSLNKSFIHGAQVDTGGALNFWYFVDFGLLKQLYPTKYVELINKLIYLWSPISAVIFSVAVLAILKRSIQKVGNFENLMQVGILVSWSYFIWRTGVHANHLYITVLVALCLAIAKTNKKNVTQYAWLCFLGLSPILTHGFPIPSGFIETFGYNFWFLGLLSVLNISVYIYYLLNYLRNMK